jgi:PIN domain nuclease of toxin-antitoxin system
VAGKFLLDACAVISYLNDEEGADKVEEVVVGLRKSVFKEAGRFKATYKVSLADSIALAEAKEKRIPLVTCDHHEFDRIQPP